MVLELLIYELHRGFVPTEVKSAPKTILSDTMPLIPFDYSGDALLVVLHY